VIACLVASAGPIQYYPGRSRKREADQCRQVIGGETRWEVSLDHRALVIARLDPGQLAPRHRPPHHDPALPTSRSSNRTVGDRRRLRALRGRRFATRLRTPPEHIRRPTRVGVWACKESQGDLPKRTKYGPGFVGRPEVPLPNHCPLVAPACVPIRRSSSCFVAKLTPSVEPESVPNTAVSM
jgi:hypothetical protein